jgi:UrcA family protein
MFRTFTTAAMLTLAITAAQAGDTVVRFGDLDLSRKADVQVLNSRIEKAAKAGCAQFKSYRTSLYYTRWYASCMSGATAEMSARIAGLSPKYRTFASK